MPKQGQDTSLLPFPGGLNTEANRFNYPEGCTVDEQNFVITKDGKRERRLGIILGEDDVLMAPEGITFNDVIRIKNVDEEGVITDLYEFSEETWEEYENFNITATYRGLVSYSLNFTTDVKIVINVYGDGAYAEVYWVDNQGKKTLKGKYNDGEFLGIPVSIIGWTSTNNSIAPSNKYQIKSSSTFHNNFKNWLQKFVPVLKLQKTEQTSGWYKANKTENYHCTRMGGVVSSWWECDKNTKNGYGVSDITWNFPKKYYSAPSIRKVRFRYTAYKSSVYTDWQDLTLNEISNVTSSYIKLNSYGKITRMSNTIRISLNPRNYEYSIKVSGDEVLEKSGCTLRSVEGVDYEVKNLSTSSNPTAEISVITGTGQRLVQKSKLVAIPDYSKIVQAMDNPQNYIDVLSANYEGYTNKTRNQIGKKASVEDQSVPRHFLWKNAGGVQGEELSVFYNAYKITICKHSPPYLFNNVVWETDVYGAQDLACVDGRLVIVNGNTDLVRAIEYDHINESFNEKNFVLMTRDLWGLSEKNIGKQKSKTKSASRYDKYGGSGKTVDIKHNWNITNSEYTQYVSVLKTGGNVSSFTHRYLDSNTIRVTYTSKSGKSKVTATFKAIYSTPDTGVVSLDEDQRVSPNETRLYNNYNMGWYLPRKDSTGNQTNPVNVFLGKFNKYPSHKDSVFTALNLNPGYLDTNNHWTTAWERLYPELWDDSRNSEDTRVKPAMGSAIIPVIKRGVGRFEWYKKNVKDKAGAISISSIPNEYSVGGPSCCCDYAGHMFYGGFSNTVINGDDKSPVLGSYLFFSRLVKSYEDLDKCYQEGDPNSRTEADLVDTDGGFVRVSGAEGIIKLVQSNKGMLIFAQNGVWMLMGGSDYGFSATNHKIQKLTSFGVNHRDSICGDGNTWMYFSEGGIMMLSPDQFGDIQCTNMSYNVIHKDFKDFEFPLYGVIGSYNPVNTSFHWMVECNSSYSTELIFEGSRQAWTYNVFYNDYETGKYVLSPICLDEEFPTNIGSSSNYRNYQSVCYLCRDSAIDDDPNSDNYMKAIQAEYRIGYCGNINYMDFGKRDAKAFLQSGPINAGNPGVYKQTPWINAYMVTTEKNFSEGSQGGIADYDNPQNISSAKMRCCWDWTTSRESNRWSPSFELYRHRQPKMLFEGSPLPSLNEIVESRSKIRGRGKSLSYIIETEAGRDCRIAGLNITMNGNQFK